MVSLEKMMKIGAIGLLTGCMDMSPLGPNPYIVINPSYPAEDNDLTCKVKEHEGNVYVYNWFLDEDEDPLFTSTGKKSVLAQGYTRPGDLIFCTASIPVPNAATISIGYNSVYVD